VLNPAELKFFVSNAPAGASVQEMLLVAFSRWRVDKAHPDSTSSLGWSRIGVSDYNSRRRVA
jgi:SRSO17 transposase